MQKIATEFNVNGVMVKGYFHKPDNSNTATPIIIMLNGYATEWQFGSAAFINAFTDNGFATLNFDYRGFGASAGTPRQVVDIPAQIEDAKAAFLHASQQVWVDTTRIIVWGSSLGGGHALSLAALEPKIAALIAQVPHCDSRAAFNTVTISAVLKGMFFAMVDTVRGKCGLTPLCVPVVAETGRYAVMNHAHWYQHYLQLAADSPTWTNAIPARSLLRGADYRPVMQASTIQCASLLIAGDADAGVPLSSVQEAAAKIANVELVVYQGDHFEVYGGEQQAGIIQKQVDFLTTVMTK